ncbi:MAG: RHS repeat-associated core domain-containing protein, partial [Lishizhenia sp.]
MEYDNEIQSGKNSYTTEFRQYDPRLGRWKSLDPLKSKAVNWTPYRFAFNSPLLFSDKPGTYERQRIIVTYKDGTQITITKRINGKFLKGKVSKHTQYFLGIPTSCYKVYHHYSNYETVYHLTEEQYLKLDKNQDVSDYTATSENAFGDERFSHTNSIFGNPHIIDTDDTKEDREMLLGITMSGNFGDDGKDTKTTAKYSVEVSSEMQDLLKLMQKNKKLPTGKGIDWSSWDEGKVINKI